MEKSATYRWTWIIVLIILLGITNSCSEEIIESETLQEMNLSHNAGDVIEDQYIVLVSKHPAKNDRMAPAALEALSKEVGSMNGARIKGTFKHSVTGFVAKLSPQQVEKLKKDPRVISVTADRYIEFEGFSTTNTATVYEYPDWGLDRIDQRAVKMDRAYVYNSTGTGVTAYIMDTGIRLTHDEFEGRAFFGIDMEFLIDPENIDPEQEPGSDCFGHGTHVAGSIGGKNFGVAKNVEIISVKVNPKCENRTPLSYLIGGIDWITNHAVINNKFPAVVNMSLGAIYNEDYDPMEYAIENSIASGLNFIVSAGNANREACDFSPARIPGALSVGASDVSNIRAPFSNYGNCLDLYAPGVAITSAVSSGDTDTRAYSGTSMSAPLVTGVVALYLEKNPEATPAEVHSAIVENSTPNFISDVPSGPANFAHSLWEAVDFTPPPAPEIEIKGFLSKVRGQHAINIQWNAPEEKSYIVYRDGFPVARSDVPRFDHGGYSYLEYTALRDATFVYKVCGLNYDNCSRELTVVIGKGGDSSTPTNSPPMAYFSYTRNWLNVQFTDSSIDGDGTIEKWLWNFGDGNFSYLQNPAHNYSRSGGYYVELTVTDNQGATGKVYKDIYVYSQEPEPVNFILSANSYKEKGLWRTSLYWSPSNTSSMVDIYRNGNLLITTNNAGSYGDITNFKGSGTLIYKLCEAGTDVCTNEVTVQF